MLFALLTVALLASSCLAHGDHGDHHHHDHDHDHADNVFVGTDGNLKSVLAQHQYALVEFCASA